MNDPRRFAGSRFGLSISASADLPVNSNPEQFINSLTFRLASNILLEGGALVMGHRWRPEGIMESLCFQAYDSRSFDWKQVSSIPNNAVASILNIIAWPDSPPAKDKNAERMISQGVLEIRTVLPPNIPGNELPEDGEKAFATELGRFARIRALTAMRQEMARSTDMRICIGGDTGNPARRLPGVLEEALVTLLIGKPLCISGALGGISKAMADAILHRRQTDQARTMFFTPEPVTKLFAEFAGKYAVAEMEGPSVEGGWNALNYFQSLSISKLSQQAGLTEDEYVILLTSTDVQRALSLAMNGMLRLRSSAASK